MPLVIAGSSTFFDAADLLFTVLGGLLAVILFLRGLREYSQQMLWKRNEFVAGEIKEFNGDPHVRNALAMLDWGERMIELYPGREPYEARFRPVSHAQLVEALRSHVKSSPFSADEVAIRDTFDIFLGYLDRFANFIQTGLVTREEFRPYLLYWISLIELELSPEVHASLRRYIREYGFTGTEMLIEAYIPSLNRPPESGGVREEFERQERSHHDSSS